MTRQLLNTTGAAIFIDDIGLNIPPGFSEIAPERYLYFAGSNDIDLPIDLGNIQVVDEDGFILNPFDGKALIHEITDYVDITVNGSPGKRKVVEIDFNGPFSVTDNGNGSASVNSLPSVGAGGIYSLDFGSSSAGSDYYLSYLFRPLGSDRSPAVVPFDSTIIAMTFSNDDTGVDVTIQVLRAPMGTPNSSATNILNWQLANVKHARSCFNIDVDAGDKIALYMSDDGKNPDDPRVALWLLPRNANCVNISDNLGQDFPVDGIDN